MPIDFAGDDSPKPPQAQEEEKASDLMEKLLREAQESADALTEHTEPVKQPPAPPPTQEDAPPPSSPEPPVVEPPPPELTDAEQRAREREIADFYDAVTAEMSASPPSSPLGETLKVEEAAPEPVVLPHAPVEELPVDPTVYPPLRSWQDIPAHVFNANDEIVVTELLRGTHVRVAVINGEHRVGTRRRWLQKPDALFDFVQESGMFAELEHMYPGLDVVLYGVLYDEEGSSHFRFFDLAISGKFVEDYQLIRLMNNTQLQRVPLLYRGRFNSLALRHAETVANGIVVKSSNFPNHPAIGRKIAVYYRPGTEKSA